MTLIEITKPSRMARALNSSKQRVINILGHGGRLEAISAGRNVLFNKIIQQARAENIPVQLVELTPRVAALKRERTDLHLMCSDLPGFAPNTFHVVPHYMNRYWYFDEVSVRHNSSLRLMTFHPNMVPSSKASRHFERMQEKFVAGNRSKFDQAPRGADLKQGGIAIFCQDLQMMNANVSIYYLEMEAMIDAVLAMRGDRHVWIKPHPEQSPASREVLRRYHAPETGVFVTDVSIHDLLDAACVTVSQSSAVAFEGFLHQTPAVVCGQTDFHHNSVVVQHIEDMASGIERAINTDWPFSDYVYWHTEMNMIAPQSDEALAHMCARIRAKGFHIGANLSDKF